MQNCELGITQTTVHFDAVTVQLYNKYLPRCPEFGVAKDAFYLSPRRGFKYFDNYSKLFF